MAAPQITIKEESIAAALLSNATGRMAMVVESAKGSITDFIFIEDERDLLASIGEPTTDLQSRDFHVVKAFLQYGNDVVLRRAYDPDTAQQSRIAMDFSATATGETIVQSITDTGDDVLFTDYTQHVIKSPNDLEFYAKDPSLEGNTLSVAISNYGAATGETLWVDNTDKIDGTTLFTSLFEFGPDSSKEEVALVVMLNGVAVESFIVSLNLTNKNTLGELNYITDYLNAKSSYIHGFAGSSVYTSVTSITSTTLLNGTPGTQSNAQADIETAYSFFTNKDEIQFDYIGDGTHSANRAYIQASIVDARKDCIGFFGPPSSAILNIANTDTIVANLVTDRQTLTNDSRTIYYGNWRQMFDKYQGKDIWIPMTGDIIGNKVGINTSREVWIPAAGNTNGRLKGITKLAFNPSTGQKDTMYNAGVNHIVFKAGKGFIIDGQKTMIDVNTGVSRLHNRDLFRIVENYVGPQAENFLHEFNNQITRDRFKNLVEPFLDDIVARGGIVDFEVICDDSNNPPAVVDANGFRADIKIKGQRAIESILLTFFDVPTGIDFSET